MSEIYEVSVKTSNDQPDSVYFVEADTPRQAAMIAMREGSVNDDKLWQVQVAPRRGAVYLTAPAPGVKTIR